MKRILLSCLLMLTLAACGGVNVQTEIGEKADFTHMVAYGWLDMGDVSLEGVRVDNPAVAGWVKNSVEKELKKKGYIKATQGQPDFLISWFGAVETKVKVDSISHLYSSYGYGPVASSMPIESQKGDTIREYKEGTILLDVLDPVSHTMVWRGSGTDRVLQDLSEEEAALYVNRLVKNILKTFPTAKK